MKFHTRTLQNHSITSEMTEPIPGKPVLVPVVRLLWAAALVLPTFVAQASVVFTSLYSFSAGNDGAEPNCRLWCRAATAIFMALATPAAALAPASKSAATGR
jgi:hypothetical protein